MTSTVQSSAPFKRKMENLARTGTEYPIMKQAYKFITNEIPEEPLSERPCL